MYISVGSVIIDDIVLPDGQVQMGKLGGGAVHAVMGMRVWSDQVGLMAPVGENFPPELRAQLAERFDLGGLMVRPIITPRAWQLFEPDGTRIEVFRTDFHALLETFPRREEMPADWVLRGVHLHCPPEDTPAWAVFLRERGAKAILWEPYDTFYRPENRYYIAEAAGLVEVLSPNLNEGRAVTGLHDPDEVCAALLADGARCVALRMGELGSLVVTCDGQRYRIPAVPPAHLVDVTGAGNAYCGGFVVGLAETGDLQYASCCGAVSASFVLEQFGAVYPIQGLHEEAQRRLARVYTSLPNPRRSVFESMAPDWDRNGTPPGIDAKLARFVAAGLAGVDASEWVLDIGSGTGGLQTALQAAHHGPALAMDLALNMLTRLRARFSSAHVLPAAADVMALPLANGSAAAIFCHGVFPHFTDRRLALVEIQRVLKAGGRLVISLAAGRARINAIHSGAKAAVLHADLMPAASELAELLAALGWRVLEQVDGEDLFLLVAEKPELDHFMDIYHHKAADYHRMIETEDVEQHLLPALQEIAPLAGRRILDLGSGSGRIPLLLRELQPKILAMDLHRAMLDEQVRQRERVGGTWPLMQADMRALPYPAAWAEVSIAGWSIGHLRGWYDADWKEQIGRILREILRVTAPGGSLIILETLTTGSLTPAPPTPGLAEYYAWLESEWGFKRSVISTDYIFNDVQSAVQYTLFFFGAELAESIRRNQWIRLPEWTGIWSRTA